MSVSSFRVERTRYDLSRAFGNASQTWSRRESLLVRVEWEGVSGIGEAAPLPGFSVETIDEAEEELVRAGGALVAPGGEAGLAEVDAAVRSAALTTASARFALETALLDILAKRRRIPLWALLAEGNAVPSVALSTLLPRAESDEVLASAQRAMACGFRCIKLKVGVKGRLEDELRLVARLRFELGADVRLRLDANGAWSPDEAARALRSLEASAPELVEEPVTGGAWLSLEPGPVPLGIDETLATDGGPAIAFRLLRSGVCRTLVAKPTLLGGVLPCLALARSAAAFGGEIVVTHMFEGVVATAAAAALAIAAGASRPAGLDIRAYLGAVPDGHPIGRCEVRAVETVGLGVSV